MNSRSVTSKTRLEGPRLDPSNARRMEATVPASRRWAPARLIETWKRLRLREAVREVPRDALHEPVGDRHDQPRLLRQGDEEVGREEPLARVPPAEEGLRADAAPGADVDDRQVADLQLAAAERAPQLPRQRRARATRRGGRGPPPPPRTRARSRRGAEGSLPTRRAGRRSWRGSARRCLLRGTGPRLPRRAPRRVSRGDGAERRADSPASLPSPAREGRSPSRRSPPP